MPGRGAQREQYSVASAHAACARTSSPPTATLPQRAASNGALHSDVDGRDAQPYAEPYAELTEVARAYFDNYIFPASGLDIRVAAHQVALTIQRFWPIDSPVSSYDVVFDLAHRLRRDAYGAIDELALALQYFGVSHSEFRATRARVTLQERIEAAIDIMICIMYGAAAAAEVSMASLTTRAAATSTSVA